MNTFPKVQGDINDTIVVTLAGIADLTTASSVRALLRHAQTGTTATLSASVLSAVDRTITVVCGGGAGWLATAAVGTWNLEYEVTFADSTVLTWPAGAPDKIIVRADL